MDRGAWKATVHQVAESRTRLSDWYFHFSLSLSMNWNISVALTQPLQHEFKVKGDIRLPPTRGMFYLHVPHPARSDSSGYPRCTHSLSQLGAGRAEKLGLERPSGGCYQRPLAPAPAWSTTWPHWEAGGQGHSSGTGRCIPRRRTSGGPGLRAWRCPSQPSHHVLHQALLAWDGFPSSFEGELEFFQALFFFKYFSRLHTCNLKQNFLFSMLLTLQRSMAVITLTKYCQICQRSLPFGRLLSLCRENVMNTVKTPSSPLLLLHLQSWELEQGWVERVPVRLWLLTMLSDGGTPRRTIWCLMHSSAAASWQGARPLAPALWAPGHPIGSAPLSPSPGSPSQAGAPSAWVFM